MTRHGSGVGSAPGTTVERAIEEAAKLSMACK